MKPVLLALPGNEATAQALAGPLEAEVGRLLVRRFPDGESYVRIESPVRDAEVMLVGTLHEPDDKLLPLYFAASTARDLGARRVGLVAPYLAYMRQDRRFHEGEGVTSEYFARLLSSAVDWLVTVDPHLHRHHALAEIYDVPTRVVHAAPAMAEWIREEVTRPVLVGPDEESAQWVSEVAAAVGAPFVVLRKVRRGDRDVEISLPDMAGFRQHTPVLVDDIISTAHTMIEAVRALLQAGLVAPICVGVHPVFAGTAYEDLLAAGAARVVTCGTIPHPSNGIDLTAPLTGAIRELLLEA